MYLSCVATVIQLDDPALSRLKRLPELLLLSEEETDALLALVILLSPDELIGKVFFPSEDCRGHSNQFYELSAVSHMLAVADNIVIGGERKRVGKIMFFQRSWMENNYPSDPSKIKIDCEGWREGCREELPHSAEHYLRPGHALPLHAVLAVFYNFLREVSYFWKYSPRRALPPPRPRSTSSNSACNIL